MEPKRVILPQDEGEHNHIIEWWYWNGNLRDRRGNEYAFMNCLFKADLKRVGFPLISELPLPVKTVHFSHSLLSDINKMKFYPGVNYFVRLSKDSFRKPALFAKYGNCLMEKTGNSEYRLRNDYVDLGMKLMKRPLLEGGRGFFNLPGRRSTYYYSLTDLKTSGTITLNGKKIRVRGRSWMDHQWANNRYARDRWTWFSIQLENGTDVVCFEYGKRKRHAMACIMDRRGRQTSTTKVRFVPTGKSWTSPHTKATYPLSWRIEMPGKKTTIELEPLIKEQEMLYGIINYWEGPMKAKAKVNGRTVKGRGFMELVGYIPKCPLSKLLKNGLEDAIMQEFHDARRIAEKILD